MNTYEQIHSLFHQFYTAFQRVEMACLGITKSFDFIAMTIEVVQVFCAVLEPAPNGQHNSTNDGS